MDVSKAEHAAITFSEREPGSPGISISNDISMLSPANLTEIQRAVSLQRDIISRKLAALSETHFAGSEQKELLPGEPDNLLAMLVPFPNFKIFQEIDSLKSGSPLAVKPHDFPVGVHVIIDERVASPETADVTPHSFRNAQALAPAKANLSVGIDKSGEAIFSRSSLNSKDSAITMLRDSSTETSLSIDGNVSGKAALSDRLDSILPSGNSSSGERIQNSPSYSPSYNAGYLLNTHSMTQIEPIAKIAQQVNPFIEQVNPFIEGTSIVKGDMPDSHVVQVTDKKERRDAISATLLTPVRADAAHLDNVSPMPVKQQQRYDSSEQPAQVSGVYKESTLATSTLNYKFSSWKNSPMVSVELNKTEGVVATTDNLDVRYALTENYYLLSNSEPLRFNNENHGEKQHHQNTQDEPDSDEEGA